MFLLFHTFHIPPETTYAVVSADVKLSEQINPALKNLAKRFAEWLCLNQSRRGAVGDSDGALVVTHHASPASAAPGPGGGDAQTPTSVNLGEEARAYVIFSDHHEAVNIAEGFLCVRVWILLL